MLISVFHFAQFTFLSNILNVIGFNINDHRPMKGILANHANKLCFSVFFFFLSNLKLVTKLAYFDMRKCKVM